MLKALGNAWSVPELRRKLMFTAAILILYRLGCWVPLPGVNREALGSGLDTQGNAITGLFGVFTGGAFNNLSVFALGIMPYITASIVMQLMTVAIPRLHELAKEGETGQQNITQYTRYFTLVLAAVQSLAMVLFFRSGSVFPGVLTEATVIDLYLIWLTLTTGTMLIMWLGELISQRGLGNGISLIISAAILSQAPSAVQTLYDQGNVLNIVILGVLAVVIIAAIVFVNEGQRRIPITYAKRQVGRRMSQGGTTYLPLKVNMAGVIPIIFASSLLIFPVILSQFAGGRPELYHGENLELLQPRRPAVPDPVRPPGLDVHVLLHGGAVQPDRAGGQPQEERRLHSWDTSGPADGSVPKQRADQDHALRRDIPGDGRGSAVPHHEYLEPG